MDYFTSDLHHNHKKLLQERGFSTVEEMDEVITKSINDTCGKDDTLYILGDVVMEQHCPRFLELFGSIKAVSDTKLEVTPVNAPNFDITVEQHGTTIPYKVISTVTSKKDNKKSVTYTTYSHCKIRFAQFMASLTDVQCTDMVKKK